MYAPLLKRCLVAYQSLSFPHRLARSQIYCQHILMHAWGEWNTTRGKIQIVAPSVECVQKAPPLLLRKLSFSCNVSLILLASTSLHGQIDCEEVGGIEKSLRP